MQMRRDVMGSETVRLDCSNDSGKRDPRLWQPQGSDAIKLGCAVDPRSLGPSAGVRIAHVQWASDKKQAPLAVEASGGPPARLHALPSPPILPPPPLAREK
jgi:hypothetical protein